MQQTEHDEIGVMDTYQIQRFLTEHTYAHLGCQSKGQIYIVPISYAYNEGNIYGYSRDGKKIEMMRQNPNVCVQVESIHDLFHWKSVICWGEFEELSGLEAHRAVRLLNQKLLILLEIESGTDLGPEFERLLEDAIIFRVVVKQATGRFEG